MKGIRKHRNKVVTYITVAVQLWGRYFEVHINPRNEEHGGLL